MKKHLSGLFACSLIMFTQALFADDTASMQQEINQLKLQVESLAAVLDEKATETKSSSTTIGGYGEHHLNNLDGNDKDMIDAHRFVLFINHEYSEDLKLFTELEVEHGFVGEDGEGEVELEQAFIEKTFENGSRLTMGQFLIPVGLMNESHEPDTFYGVERNNVEGKIIPATWWETGVMYSNDLEHFSYDVAVHSSLKAVYLDGTNGLTSTSIREGRQKSAKADGNEPAFTVRVKAKPVKGVELALSLQHQSDLSGGNELGVSADLVNANLVWQLDRLTTKVVYAQWSIDDKYEGYFDGVAGSSMQEGLLAELSYKLRSDLGVFTRYSEWDNAADDSIESAYDQVDVGVNYWLDERVVVKADYQMQTNNSDDSELNGVNLGLGWSF